MKIDLWNLLSNTNTHADIDKKLRNKIYFKILRETSITKFGKKVKITCDKLVRYFSPTSKRRYKPTLKNLLDIASFVDIRKEKIFNYITGFGYHNSQVRFLPRYLNVDREFILAYGIYRSEGRSNHKRGPKKGLRPLSLGNTNLQLVKLFLEWARSYFQIKDNKVHCYVYSPHEMLNKNIIISKLAGVLKIEKNNIKVYKDSDRLTVFIQIDINDTLISQILDVINPVLRKIILNDKKLSLSYLTGILAGDGTVYHYCVALKMKDESEMDFICKILDNLKIDHSPMSLTEGKYFRITITGRNNLSRLSFGPQEDRNQKLKFFINPLR